MCLPSPPSELEEEKGPEQELQFLVHPDLAAAYSDLEQLIAPLWMSLLPSVK